MTLARKFLDQLFLIAIEDGLNSECFLVVGEDIYNALDKEELLRPGLTFAKESQLHITQTLHRFDVILSTELKGNEYIVGRHTGHKGKL
jgi:hypothetical protein